MGTKIVEASDTRMVVTTRAWNLLFGLLGWIVCTLLILFCIHRRDEITYYVFLAITLAVIPIDVLFKLRDFNEMVLDKEAGTIIVKNKLGSSSRSFRIDDVERVEYVYGRDYLLRLPMLALRFKDGGNVGLLELRWTYYSYPSQELFDRHLRIAGFIGVRYQILSLFRKKLLYEYDFSTQGPNLPTGNEVEDHLYEYH